jgi:hypothetical protein
MTRVLKCHPKSQITTLDNNPAIPDRHDVLYFSDWFDSVFLDEVVANFGPIKMVICDVESTILPTLVPVQFIPALGMGMTRWIKYANLDFAQVLDYPNPTCCFSFSIRKKRPTRYLLLKLIEWFDLQSYTHTWSGEGRTFDCSKFIQEFSSINKSWSTVDLHSFLLNPVEKIQVNWYPHDSSNFFQEKIWLSVSQRSVVSLITECSTGYQSNFTFSEKSLMPLLCLNFPIWVGNYGQAQQAQQMGFDVFEDVIDHSYQYQKTLVERCYHAINDNLSLLTDLDLAKRTQQKYLDRLIANQKYILNGGFEKWAHGELQKLPDIVKSLIQEFMHR